MPAADAAVSVTASAARVTSAESPSATTMSISSVWNSQTSQTQRHHVAQGLVIASGFCSCLPLPSSFITSCEQFRRKLPARVQRTGGGGVALLIAYVAIMY